MSEPIQQNDLFKRDIDAVQSIPVVPTILDLICKTTGMGFAAIARVTDQHWVTCGVKDEILFGLQPGDELEVESTICHEVRQAGKIVVIDHVAEDEMYRNHHTPQRYGFQSYISVPIVRRDGSFFGTLCAIDPQPNKINNKETIDMFRLYSDLIAFHLETVERMQASEDNLIEERHIAELRDQFIAILGHDLRNPVNAIANSLQLLERLSLENKAEQLIDISKKSTYRMKELIDNVLDFARGKLGDGITLNRKDSNEIKSHLVQIIDELQVVWLDRDFIVSTDISASVNCDANRIAQVMSNLIGNALTHGDQSSPVDITLQCDHEQLLFIVANSGKQISQSAMDRMFKPFYRDEVNPNQQGLGLGLYISSEIVKAHGGTLQVHSFNGEITFTMTIPQ